GATAQVQLSREPFGALHPRVGADKSRIVVAFAEDQNPVFLLSIAESSDDGKTWNQLANAAEGNPGLTLSDAERAALRFPAHGTSKPIWKFMTPFIGRPYVFGSTTIVALPDQPSRPDDRAIVAADPGVGLFRGRSAALRRCPDAAAVEPQPLAPREQPV